MYVEMSLILTSLIFSDGELERISGCNEISIVKGNIINSDTVWDITGNH